MNKPFHTFSLSSSSSCLAAGTVQYVHPTHAPRKVKFEVGKTYHIKYKSFYGTYITEYEVLITLIADEYIEASYLALIKNGNKKPYLGAFDIDRILEVAEIEAWTKYYTLSYAKSFNVGCVEPYLMRKSNGVWETCFEKRVGRRYSTGDGDAYDKFVANGSWVETTPEKAFSRDKD